MEHIDADDVNVFGESTNNIKTQKICLSVVGRLV